MFGSLHPLAGLWPLGTLGPPAPNPAGLTLRGLISQRLKSSTALAALVDNRIFLNRKPQRETYPCVTFDVAGSSRPYTLTGSPGLSQSRFRVSCWSYSSVESESMAMVILSRMESWGGPSSQVQGCFLQNTLDMPEGPQDGSDKTLFRIILDFSLTYND